MKAIKNNITKIQEYKKNLQIIIVDQMERLILIKLIFYSNYKIKPWNKT